MLQAPIPCGFDLIIDSQTGRPTSGAGQTTVTGNAAADTKSTPYTQIFSAAAVTNDVYGVRISASALGAGGATRQALFDVATDPAGGTTYADVIPNLAVMPFGAASSTTINGVWSYFFPLFIKAGSSIAIRAQSATGAIDTQYRMWLYCKPTRPESWRTGTYVETIGADLTNTRGVAVTPGGASEGAWASLGTTTKRCWFWQAAAVIDDTTMTAGLVYDFDLGTGDGTSNVIIHQGLSYWTTSTESMQPLSYPMLADCVHETAAGASIYGRCQCSGTSDSNVTMIAYGLGG
jgi:hypothetical protein